MDEQVLCTTQLPAFTGFPTSSPSNDYYYLYQRNFSFNPLPPATTVDHNPTYNATLHRKALSVLQQRQSQKESIHLQVRDPLVVAPLSSPQQFTTSPLAITDTYPTSAVPAGRSTETHHRPMFSTPSNSMGMQIANYGQGIKRARSHQRTPSASTVASNGPVSPFMHNSINPHIANVDQDPHASTNFVDQPIYSKNPPTPSHTPVTGEFYNNHQHANNYTHTPSSAPSMSSAHLAMKGFGIDHHFSDDFTPDLSSRKSASSQPSPATPQSGAGDTDARMQSTYHDARPSNPHIQLFRTESQAFQDELYNPSLYQAPTSMSKSNHSLQASQRTQLHDRLVAANDSRSLSPTSMASRERSPFREGSSYAVQRDWNPSIPQTAADIRRLQQEESAQAEFGKQQRATLRREPTKTVSPKETFLDYNESDQQPLFQDSIPAGYKVHTGIEEWANQGQFIGQQGATYTPISAANEHDLGFMSTATPAFSVDYSSLPPRDDITNQQYQHNYVPAMPVKMNGFQSTHDHTPDFPPPSISMETSISDLGPAPSSQDTDYHSPQRPDDTRANTGTYTCTYHGCVQRFESQPALQRHKRDYHRSQQQQHRDTTSMSGTASLSPRSTESPAPSTMGMTSAAILARNSQAGPHKCTRINPSTNKPCNTVFSRPYDLTRHEDTIHNNRKQKVRCPMCREEKTFSRNDALTRHMRVVHPDVESFGKRGRRGD